MRTGTRVRVRPASPVCQRLGMPPDSQGVVICSYSLFRDFQSKRDRVDVRFGPHLVLWGEPEMEFELVKDPA